MSVTKAIIPVAGYGTRRLPITKSLEKCMLPVLNRPIVDYVVQDCIAAGIRDFYFVINSGAQQLRSFYGRDETLHEYLVRNKKERMLPLIEPPKDCTFHFIDQDVNESYGTTVPVWLCREFIKPGEQFLVIMGDQFFYNADGSSEAKAFLDAAENAGTQAAMLAVEIPREEVSKYGIVSVRQDGNRELYVNIVEKPSVEEAPSNLNNGSFFLFDQKIFEFLEAGMHTLHDGEYYIIDVVNDYAAAGNDVIVLRNRGQYMDCGSVEGWLAANNQLMQAQ